MKTKIIAAAALIASTFTPISFTIAPALAGHSGAGNPSLCPASNNPNIEYLSATTHYNGDLTVVGAPRRSGSSGNVFVDVEVYEGSTDQTCIATNTNNGNPVPGQNETFEVDAGGDLLSSTSVKVCQNTSSGSVATTANAGDLTTTCPTS
jgi:hypothetical protein